MSTIRPSSAPSLFGLTRQAVLALFFCHPDESFYLRQAVRRTRCAVGAVQRELRHLTAGGILTRTQQGNQVHFRANRQCPIFNELQSLMTKTAGTADIIRTALSPLSERIRLAFIYGSFARGDYRADSDIDLMVIGTISFADIASALRPVQDKLFREINPTIYPPAEFRKKRAQKHHFLTRLLHEPMLWLMGTDHELAAMGK
jgi:predicted nucleotidyltransferase